MDTTIGIYEAKTQLFRLIDRAATGGRIVITRNAVAVAELRAVGVLTRTRNQVVVDLVAFRQTQHGMGKLREMGETRRELAHEAHTRSCPSS